MKKAFERWIAYLEEVLEEQAQEAQETAKRELRNRRISQLSVKIVARWKCVAASGAFSGWLAHVVHQKGWFAR